MVLHMLVSVHKHRPLLSGIAASFNIQLITHLTIKESFTPSVRIIEVEIK